MRRAWFILCCWGCTDPAMMTSPDAGPGPDAGPPPIFTPSPIAAPAEPMPPAAPQLTPCPTGWTEVTDDLPVAYCEPFPAGSGTICPVDQMLLPGSAACAAVGSPCPTNDIWAEDLPTDRTVLFVQPNAAGGNGTRASPFGSIGAALTGLPADVVLALARGTYAEDVLLDRDVTLWGACTASTEVRSIRVEGGTATLRNLRVGGGGTGIRVVGAAVQMEDVVVAGAGGSGLFVEAGGTADGTRVVLRESGGRGVIAQTGAQVRLSQVEVYANTEFGVKGDDPGTLISMSDATIRDTLPAGDGSNGMGFLFQTGATFQLERGALERNRSFGGWMYDQTNLTLTDVTIRQTRPTSNGDTDGMGLRVQLGSGAELDRVLIDGSHSIGLLVSETASARATDLIVTRTESQRSDGAGGRGINAQLHDALSLERALLFDNREQSVFLAGGTATLKDVTIEETRSQISTIPRPLGTGLSILFGAAVTAERLHVVRARQGGIVIAESAEATLTDVQIEDILGMEGVDDTGGLGIAVQGRATLQGERIRIERCFDQGLFGRDEGTRVEVEDLIIRDIEAEVSTQKFGRGLAMEVTAFAEVSRVLIERVTEHGVMANGFGAELRLQDVVVRDVRQRADGLTGRALAAQTDARIEVTRGDFDGARELAVFLSGSAVTATLTDIRIANTESRTDGIGGRGLDVYRGARVLLQGALLENNREFSALAHEQGSLLTMRDVIVTGTRENACPDDECGGFGRGGTGVAAAKGAAVVMNRFVVSHSALAGLALTRAGTIDLEDGEVAFNPVGVNVDGDDFDITRLQNDVRYHDNDLTLQSTSLPEPRTSDVIAGVE